MANAKKAPLVFEGSSEVLEKTDFLPEYEFDINKKYMFELVNKNPERELPVIDGRTNRAMSHKEFKPYQNIVLTSQIVWNKQRRNIRYYDGCTTLFVDEQPKDRETIEQLMKQTKPRGFNDGKFGVHGDERLLIIYLMICSWNGESEYRTRTADVVFIPSNADKKSNIDSKKLDQTEEALKYAKEASALKMNIHASYLGIPMMDYDSGNELSESQIRTEYRKEALRNSAKFIESYGDKTLEIKYYINKALEKGTISNKLNQSKAAWSNGNVICDISGLRSHEAISQKLFEFSQLEEGEEFLIQLKAISE
jgi:hypothetical protein